MSANENTRHEDSRIKIGLPNALVGLGYNIALKHFFEELGAEVIVSGPTTKRTIELGTQIVDPEYCVPVKIFFGHVAELLEDTDFVFVLRLVSDEKKTFTCPKFLALPDLARLQFEDEAHRFLELEIEKRFGIWSKKGVELHLNLKRQINYLAEFFGVSSKMAGQAFKEGLVLKEEYEHKVFKEKILPNGLLQPKKPDLKISLIGHPYNISDPILSQRVVEKLIGMNAEIVTMEMIDKKEIEKAASEELPKPLFWGNENTVAGAVFHQMKHGDSDGIIFFLSFICGPDALVQPFIEDAARRYAARLMIVTVDEHSGEAGTITRLEAFTDSIRMQKERVN